MLFISQILKAALVVFLVMFGGGSVQAKAAAQIPPQRILSLNLCTDQLLMMLVAPSRIVGVSAYSRRTTMSVMAKKAQSLPLIRGTAEEIFMKEPDLILAGRFTARPTVNLLRRLKHNIVELHPANSFRDIFKNIETIGKAVGETVRARELIASLRSDLATIKADPDSPLPLAALYFANGYSMGKGTLINAVVRKSGFTTLGDKRGFHGSKKISLEALILSKPDVFILGERKFSGEAKAYEVFKHPVLGYLEKGAAITSLTEALTICGTPQTIKAVRKLRQFRDQHFQRVSP